MDMKMTTVAERNVGRKERRFQVTWLPDPSVVADEFLVVHAKTFGTNVTACGILATNLYKHWDRPFDARDELACAACGQELRTPRAQGGRSEA